MPTHLFTAPPSGCLLVSTPLLPLLLLVCLPWQQLLHERRSCTSGWLWWPHAPTPDGGDQAGIAVTVAALLLLTRHKLTLDGRALLALAGSALFPYLASDWIIKSPAKQLTEEPRPYLLWLEPGVYPRHPASLCWQPGASQRTGPRRDPVAGAARLARPALAGRGQLRLPSGHSIAAMSLAQFFGLIWLARAPGVWLLPLWAHRHGLSRTPDRHALAPGRAGECPARQPDRPPGRPLVAALLLTP